MRDFVLARVIAFIGAVLGGAETVDGDGDGFHAGDQRDGLHRLPEARAVLFHFAKDRVEVFFGVMADALAE